MNKLNAIFLNEYNNLEALCNAKFGVTEGGIGKYVEAMNGATENKDKIGKWAEDYHSLAKCMHIYSVISLNGNNIRKPQCTKHDIAWLVKFAQRFGKETDSLTRLQKYETSLEKFNNAMDKVVPVAKAVAIGCGIALAFNALFGGKNGDK